MSTTRTLADLTDHLFAQLARLDNDRLTPEQMQHEIARAGAMGGIAREVISAGRLAVDAAKARAEMLPGDSIGPLGLGGAPAVEATRPRMISGGK